MNKKNEIRIFGASKKSQISFNKILNTITGYSRQNFYDKINKNNLLKLKFDSLITQISKEYETDFFKLKQKQENKVIEELQKFITNNKL